MASTTSKLRTMKKLSSRKPKDAEWRRLAEMPEPARSSPHRPYWVCARFLYAMHTLATCSRLVREKCQREAGVWCNAVVELGARGTGKRGDRHLEVWELAHEYSEFEEPFDAGMLVGLRDELVAEADEHWDELSEREQDVLLQVEAAGETGLQSGKLAEQLSHHAGFADGRPTAAGKKLLADLCDRGLLVTEGKGGYLRYKLQRKPAGWSEQ